MKLHQTLPLRADTPADKANAIRVIRKLTAGDLDAAINHSEPIDYTRHTASCQAERCNEGRKPCPCPEACQLPESGGSPWVRFALPVALVASALCMALFLYMVAREWPL